MTYNNQYCIKHQCDHCMKSKVKIQQIQSTGRQRMSTPGEQNSKVFKIPMGQAKMSDANSFFKHNS